MYVEQDENAGMAASVLLRRSSYMQNTNDSDFILQLKSFLLDDSVYEACVQAEMEDVLDALDLLSCMLCAAIQQYSSPNSRENPERESVRYSISQLF